MQFTSARMIMQSVSLFTREWIEICRSAGLHAEQNVSLFTREWIEIMAYLSGTPRANSLPLYEGVD